MKNGCVFCGRHADRSNAKPCPGTTFRGVDLLVNLRFRIHTGENWQVLDSGLKVFGSRVD